MARNAIESDFRSSKMGQIGLPKWPPAAILKKKFQKKKLCIELKWREMHSKVIFVHPKWPPAAILWKFKKVIFGHPKWPLAAILWKKSVLIWNGEKCNQKWFSVIQNGRWMPFCGKKRVANWSEMARNAIESDLRSSKMTAGSHFVNKIKVVYWSEMARNPIESDFRSSKMTAGSHFVNKIQKNKSWVLIWNGEKWDQNSFSVIQNGGGDITMASL